MNIPQHNKSYIYKDIEVSSVLSISLAIYSVYFLWRNYSQYIWSVILLFLLYVKNFSEYVFKFLIIIFRSSILGLHLNFDLHSEIVIFKIFSFLNHWFFLMSKYMVYFYKYSLEIWIKISSLEECDVLYFFLLNCVYWFVLN